MNTSTRKPTLEANNYEYIDTPEPLKLCPFCGGESRAKISKFAYFRLGVVIQCSKCHASSLPMLYNCLTLTPDGFKPETLEGAVEKSPNLWNRRTGGDLS